MRSWLPIGLALAAFAAGGAFGGEAPAKEKEAEESFEALELRMAELVNRDRAEQKLPPLAWHKELAAVARAHSLDMKAHRFFAHRSPRTGEVKDRVAAARIPARATGENLARGDTIEFAERNLMNSPKHRENILSKEFTHLGIGLARGEDGLLLVTQVFLKPTPVYDAVAVHDEIAQGINATRLQKGLRRLLPDDTLARQAQAHSARAARLGRFDPAWLEGELASDDRRWRIHTAAYYLTDKTAEVVLCDVAQSATFDHFGLGVVQAPAEGKQAGALWVTLVCAQKK